MKVAVLNGPNLNLLGKREPEIYGTTSLEEIEKGLAQKAREKNVELFFFQSNSEGELIDKMQALFHEVDVFILNPAAFTHTSLALADCVRACPKPVIEVHISNIYSREPIRQNSLIAPFVQGIISGFGPRSYFLALQAALEIA